jgi:hypothetical protein
MMRRVEANQEKPLPNKEAEPNFYKSSNQKFFLPCFAFGEGNFILTGHYDSFPFNLQMGLRSPLPSLHSSS